MKNTAKTPRERAEIIRMVSLLEEQGVEGALLVVQRKIGGFSARSYHRWLAEGDIEDKDLSRSRRTGGGAKKDATLEAIRAEIIEAARAGKTLAELAAQCHLAQEKQGRDWALDTSRLFARKTCMQEGISFQQQTEKGAQKRLGECTQPVDQRAVAPPPPPPLPPVDTWLEPTLIAWLEANGFSRFKEAFERAGIFSTGHLEFLLDETDDVVETMVERLVGSDRITKMMFRRAIDPKWKAKKGTPKRAREQ